MISVALPDIMHEFQGEVGVAGWLVTAHLVTMVVFQLIAGGLGDQWGRRGAVLDDNYFVSTGFGTQLFANQKLVTGGPYAIVRHPMYAGLLLASLGSLLIYHTCTTLLFAFFALALFIRARREEAAMEAEFGEQWHAYRNRFRQSGARDDQSDGYLLADILRTDQGRLQPVV